MAGKFRIHLFTSENPVADEASVLTRFLQAGLDCLHLRKPSYDASVTESLLRRIPECYHSRIVLHDHYHLARKYGCGVQLNSRCYTIDWMPVSVSRSCHSLSEVEQNRKLDFVTLSPVFDSISKQGYAACFDSSALSSANLSGVVALGGVTLESLPSLMDMGFTGAALLGDVWNKSDGVTRLLKYLYMRNFSLQFITDGKDISETVAQSSTVLDAGGKWIQVRMKNADVGEVRETLQELYPRCVEMGATLIVDDRFELSGLCHGVHLGQNDEPVEVVRVCISPEKIIGLTVNNSEHIKQSLSALPDYYGVGPYRFTSTKKNLSPVLGIDGYKKLAPEFPRKFVAIGGILPADIPALLEAGASGIAVSSVITRSENPYEVTKKLIHIINGK